MLQTGHKTALELALEAWREVRREQGTLQLDLFDLPPAAAALAEGTLAAAEGSAERSGEAGAAEEPAEAPLYPAVASWA